MIYYVIAISFFGHKDTIKEDDTYIMHIPVNFKISVEDGVIKVIESSLNYQIPHLKFQSSFFFAEKTTGLDGTVVAFFGRSYKGGSNVKFYTDTPIE